jgi:hypothetical protein
MKNWFLFGFLFFIMTSSYPQADSLSIAGRIAVAEYSKSDLISKGRRLLLQEFKAGNKKEVADIMHYLATEVDDDYHISLWNSERYLLFYWMGDYTEILLNIQVAAEDSVKYDPSLVYPFDHVLGQTIQTEIRTIYYDSIIEDYKSLHFSEDTNDFLFMLLNRLLKDYDYSFISQDKLNQLSDEFQKKYPYSPLNKAVQKFISYKLAAGDFGYGMSIGGGYHFSSGNITDYITQKSGFDIDFSFYYKKLHLSLLLIQSQGEVKQDIKIANTERIWGKGEKISVMKIAPIIGFNLLENNYFNLIPIAGISFNSATPSEQAVKDNPNLKDVQIKTSAMPVIGLNIDFKFSNIKNRSPYFYGPGGYFALGFRAAYWPNAITTQGENMRGQLFFIGLSLKMNFFQLKRVY